MPRFHYAALTPDGRFERGDFLAPSRMDALRILRQRGLRPQRVAAGSGATAALLRREIGGGSARRATLLAFTRELAMLLAARVKPVEALEIVSEGRDRRLARLPLADLLAAVRGGAAFADAMAAHPELFPPDYVSLVRVGQSSGALAAVMGQLADDLERRAATRSRLTGALAYPAMLVAASIGVVAILVTVVLPAFKPLFERTGAELPWTTRLVMGAADILGPLLPWLPLLLLGAYLLQAAAMRDPARRLARDRLLLTLPVIGPVVAADQFGRALRSLATLTGGGLALRPALALAADSCRNEAVATLMRESGRAVEEGRRLSTVLAAYPLAPPALSRLVRVAEESGTLPQVLDQLATMQEAALAERLTRATALLTPALTLVVGSIIALILFAILSAVLSANELVLQS